MASSHLALEAVIRHHGRTVARCLLRRGRYIIGQEKKNEIVVDAPSISGKHARLTVVDEEQFFLEDLGSANGTLVDDKPIDAIKAVTLDSHVTLGETTLSFERGGLPATVFQHLPSSFLRASRFSIGAAIVEGRTSTIFEARDTALQRPVAMRVLRSDQQSNASLVLAFIREAQITAQLTHTGILPVYDFGLDEEIGLYCATRFIEGESLADLLEGMASTDGREPHGTLYSLLLIFMKACDALSFAHARGVVHSQLRPEAIIFGRFGEVFVDHWGMAWVGQAPENETPLLPVPSLASGPPLTRYTAPEQAAGVIELDAPADVYALGAILFRILTLRHFNNGETPAEIQNQALNPERSAREALTAQPIAPHVPGGHLPERLVEACVRALEFAPDHRFKDAHDLKKEVAGWFEQTVSGGEHQKIWKQLAGLLGRH